MDGGELGRDARRAGVDETGRTGGALGQTERDRDRVDDGVGGG
ncbi:hypothetical protein ACFSTC_24130 [Nonomuraea ferruginea]